MGFVILTPCKPNKPRISTRVDTLSLLFWTGVQNPPSPQYAHPTLKELGGLRL